MRSPSTIVVLALVLGACRENATPAKVTHESSSTSFEGIVRVAPDAQPGPGKKFRGAWIERGDGERWVIEYESDSPFRELRDRRVRVEGETFVPEGQALLATHFRVRTMEIVGKDIDAPLVRVGARKKLRGRFGEKTFPPNTKLAGTTMRVFVDEDARSYFIAHETTKDAPLDVSVEVDAHEVEPSPYIARPGGPYLWIRGFELEAQH